MAAPDVRNASREDLVVVAALAASERDGLTEESLRRHLSVYLSEGGTVLVAALDERVLGFVMTRVVGPFLFAAESSLVIDALFVSPDARRRGLGHALLSGVATLAGEASAPYVYADTPAADRTIQRFLARLGFSQAGGHRVAPTAVLLRRLVAEKAPGRRDILTRVRKTSGREPLDDMVARRRKAKEAGLPTGALDLSTLQPGAKVG